MTGTANRALLMRRLPAFVAAERGLLVFIDLDGFKAVNDSHGHHVGDLVLCAVADRLAGIIREADTIARVGGDEFVILFHGAGHDEAPGIAQRIHTDLCRPVTAGSVTTRVGASIGVVVLDPEASGHPPAPAGTDVPQDEAAMEDILRAADSAMYDVKRRGGGIQLVTYPGPPSGSPRTHAA
jgi:diguanylate cyclase (GGDEF)-like protein